MFKFKNNNTSRKEGALIPLDGLIVTGTRTSDLEAIVLTDDTVLALTERCKTHTQINLSELYNQETDSEGSMPDVTDDRTKADTPGQAETQYQEREQSEEIYFDTCSDGSVHEFTHGNTAAG